MVFFRLFGMVTLLDFDLMNGFLELINYVIMQLLFFSVRLIFVLVLLFMLMTIVEIGLLSIIFCLFIYVLKMVGVKPHND